jgi:hypothetical protein
MNYSVGVQANGNHSFYQSRFAQNQKEDKKISGGLICQIYLWCFGIVPSNGITYKLQGLGGRGGRKCKGMKERTEGRLGVKLS